MRLLLVLILASGAARADEWSKTDYALLGTAATLIVIDWGQTRDLTRTYTEASLNGQPPVRTRTYKEKNPFLGEEPSIGEVDKYFAASLLFTAGVAHLLPNPYRRYFLGGMIVWQSYHVLNNHRIGLRVEF